MPPFLNVPGIRLLSCRNQISISFQADFQNMRTTSWDKFVIALLISVVHNFSLMFSLYSLSVILYLAAGAFLPVYAMETDGEVILNLNITNFDVRTFQGLL
jgi:hypothetical protein